MAVHSSACGQSYRLFSDDLKRDYPSVVYDFLERYLYEIDSLARKGEPILQRLRDDKVMFLEGDLSVAASLTSDMAFNMAATDDRFYQMAWLDTLGNTILSMAFPMQYELLLGKPKVQIEKEMSDMLKRYGRYQPRMFTSDELSMGADSVWSNAPASHYYIESLNTACYYRQIDSSHFVPIFDSADLWKSAANLFQGVIDSIGGYQLYVEQNLYGYQKQKYRVPLVRWLAYCQDMKMDVYFAVEEECEDGLKALLIAHSRDLGFNHMMSLIIPDNFVDKPNAVIKATMNAYIPTQNVKDLYQQYVSKPKKKI